MILSTIIAVLLLILYQDIKRRSIHILLLPLLFGLLFWYKQTWETPRILFFNIGFILLVILLLSVYISLKNKALTNPFAKHFGLGDLLFLIAISPLEKPQNFMFIFIAGTIFTLLVHGLVQLFYSTPTIPYAGYFSIFVILLLIVPINLVNSYFNLS